MRQSPSKFGGIAAVFVFAVGLLLVGKIATGIAVLGFGALSMALALSGDASTRFLIIAIGAIICSSVLAYHAASNEITGQAVYYRGWRSGQEPVTREECPAKFREATNLKWALSIFCAGIGTITFMFRRRLEDSDVF